MSRFLEILARPGCHLCEDALPVVEQVARLVVVPVVQTDIDRDPELAVDWGLRIPVVRWSDGTVLAEGRVEVGPLLRRSVTKRLKGD